MLGVMTFPGIGQIGRGTFTLSGGHTPSTAIIEIAPQAGLPVADGTMAITDGVHGVISFPNCRVNAFSGARNTEGLIWSLQIMDRRWKWAFGKISGHYNLRTTDNDIESGTEKTPQQLAALLFEAMGETGYSVAELPNDSRPEVRWEADNPAAQLADLCERLGCRIVPNLDNTFSIRRLGVGAELPINGMPVVDNNGSIDPPERPDKIQAFAAPTQVQLTFALEAVGLDIDGLVRPINQLSYKPAAGWSREIPGLFTSVNAGDPARPANQALVTPRSLAIETVFRWYRVVGLLGTNSVDTIKEMLGTEFSFQFDRIDQFLPLLNELVEIDTATGKPGVPFVQGTFSLNDGRHQNSATWAPYSRSFEIDLERGIVKFADYVYRWNPGGTNTSTFAEANLYLTTSTYVKHQDTRAFHRYFKEHDFGTPVYGTGPYVIKEDEIKLRSKINYNAAGNMTGWTSNVAEIDSELGFVIDASMAQFQTKTPNEVTYGGIHPIALDGAIQQVTWEVGGLKPCTTKAGRNNEFKLSVPTHKDRMLFARMRARDAQERGRRMANNQNARGRNG